MERLNSCKVIKKQQNQLISFNFVDYKYTDGNQLQSIFVRNH